MIKRKEILIKYIKKIFKCSKKAKKFKFKWFINVIKISVLFLSENKYIIIKYKYLIYKFIFILNLNLNL